MKAQTCRFGMIMTSSLGKMLDKAKNQGKPRRYLRNINVRWFGFDLSDVQEMRIAEDEVERYSIRKGDLVVCEGGEPGRCAIWCDEETVCFQKALHRVRFNEASDPRFYMYYLWMLAKSGMLAAYYTGTGIKHLTGESLKKLPVPVPPLAEQKRIVARIEELFSKLDSGVETLKKTKQQLAVYRQAVLKAAFAHVTEKKTIRKMSSVVTSGSRGWAQYYSEHGAKFVRIGNLTRNHVKIDLSDVQYVELPNDAEGRRTQLRPNDVLVSITADLGSIGLVPDDIGEAYVNQHIAMIRFNNPSQGKLMAWYLRSDYGQKDLLKNKHGGGKLGLGLDDIRDSHVPVMSDVEADSILSNIESHFSVCDRIENTIDAAVQQAESMRQIILKKAFEGALGKKRRHHVTNNYGAHE